MNGQTIGLIITIVAVVALAAGLIWLFATGTKPKWPEGVRKEAEHNGYRAVVVLGKGVHIESSWSTIAWRTALAGWATAAAWLQKKNRDSGLETVGLHLLADEEFEKRVAELHIGDPKKVNAYSSRAWQRLGSGPPMAVVRASLAEHIMSTGQPVIHELLHALGGLYHDRKHETGDVWEDRDDPEVEVEELAEKLFVA